MSARESNDNDAPAPWDHHAPDHNSAQKRVRLENDDPQQRPSRKKRALSACEVCRARKTKCSNDRPRCKYCQDNDLECVYLSQKENPERDPNLLILSKLNDIIDRLDRAGVPTPASIGLMASHRSHSRTASNSASPAVLSTSQHEPPSDSYDDEELRIPSARTSADNVLLWPIFEQRYQAHFFVSGLFTRSFHAGNGNQGSQTFLNPGLRLNSTTNVSMGISIEENVVEHVEAFLMLVYPKNPVLDPVKLRRYAQAVEENGIGWNDESCLVLLVCAVGSMAVPFSGLQAHNGLHLSGEISSQEAFSEKLAIARYYYKLAQKRIGLLSGAITKAQCHFLLGIYYSYVFQPVEAWQSFVQASLAHHTYLQGRIISGDLEDADPDSGKERAARRLEQCLYWSAFRSECDMRLQLPVLQTTTDFKYANMFPSPPENHSLEDVTTTERATSSSMESRPQVACDGDQGSVAKRTAFDKQKWEQNWFFYFTEITLRRIGNRILNALYKYDSYPGAGLTITEMFKLVAHFDEQLSEFHRKIPALLYFEKDQRVVPTQELPMITRGRFCEISSSLYRPLLYYAIHHDAADTYQTLIKPFVDKCITFGFWFIDQVAQLHRHHGTWWSVHHGSGVSLALIAASRCGHIEMPLGWETSVETHISILRYWEAECPEFAKARMVIETEFDQARAYNAPT
ncbi:hypothetical protein A1O1_03933 [Capronia coronata CBS 617.96]|uniref:Zn(2)-C6 fungal-type domain-containing protein n=1 Tax=Capronia coronata CBS 617.96 TaxID=1182541 RepID=W9YE92_9EURO|nr:uncharacterized protein A1O1_03933 [Capronia coronata CBS 617.96]EXJ90828.1 hypothetical protein A1O1_03933 [Capronia coronata CBS 617.96]